MKIACSWVVENGSRLSRRAVGSGTRRPCAGLRSSISSFTAQFSTPPSLFR
ncbi:hypothetical protein D3C73_1456670 [compost metagenome]